MTENLIAFHGGCNDGWASAWLITRHLRATGQSYVLHPGKYGAAFPWDEIDLDTHVWVVDFSYDPDTMQLLIDRGDLTWLDHHQTVADIWGEAIIHADEERRLWVQIDQRRSGAGLTYDYLSGIGGLEDMDRWLINHVENRDLWHLEDPATEEVFSYLTSLPQTIDAWDDVAALLSGGDISPVLEAGRAIVRYRQQLIQQAVENAFEVEIDGHRVWAANCIYAIASDVAGILAEDMPFGAYYLDGPDHVRSWGLRSRDGGLDVAEIAQRFGGGGHRNASGFRTGGAADGVTKRVLRSDR